MIRVVPPFSDCGRDFTSEGFFVTTGSCATAVVSGDSLLTLVIAGFCVIVVEWLGLWVTIKKIKTVKEKYICS